MTQQLEDIEKELDQITAQIDADDDALNGDGNNTTSMETIPKEEIMQNKDNTKKNNTIRQRKNNKSTLK